MFFTDILGFAANSAMAAALMGTYLMAMLLVVLIFGFTIKGK